MADLDLDAISQKWLNQCGPCDFGMPEYGCTHPSGDYRPVMLALVREVERFRVGHYFAEVRRLQEEVIPALRAERDAAIERAEMSGETTLAYEAEIERMRPVLDAAKAWADSGILRQGGPPMAEVLAGIEPAKQRLREAVAAYREAGA